jgi:hypothetical protein
MSEIIEGAGLVFLISYLCLHFGRLVGLAQGRRERSAPPIVIRSMPPEFKSRSAP